MKKLLTLVILLVGLRASSAPNDKVLQSFKNSFPSVTEVTWYDEDFGYEARFKKEGITCKVKYDQTGKVLETRRDYYGKDLQPFISARISKSYPGQTIYGVTEIQDAGGITYHVILEDTKRWYQLEVTGSGEILVRNRFFKAPSK